MKRHGWSKIRLKDFDINKPKQITVTISVDQKTTELHRAVYNRGHCVLELNNNEKPVAVYQMKEAQ